MGTVVSGARVLAVGAAGKFAGMIVPELARRGAVVRGMVRDARQADAVRKRGATEVAVADLQDGRSLRAALEGVASVFYIAPAFHPQEAEIGRGMIAAARQAGVRRFVFSSVIHPSLGALVNHSAKAPVEDAVLQSGMEYVLLQPTMFFQNLAGAWPKVVEHGVFAEPWSCETRFSRVDFRDVAEVAAIALAEDRLLNGTYELCSEGSLNRRDVAGLMREALGRDIRAAVAGSGKPGTGSPIERMFSYYNHHGLMGNPLVLRAILGREPRTLRAFIQELAATTLTKH